jgi:hypothetical protein
VIIGKDILPERCLGFLPKAQTGTNPIATGKFFLSYLLVPFLETTDNEQFYGETNQKIR